MTPHVSPADLCDELAARLRFMLARYYPNPIHVPRHCLHAPADHGRFMLWQEGTLPDRLAMRDSLQDHAPTAHRGAA